MSFVEVICKLITMNVVGRELDSVSIFYKLFFFFTFLCKYNKLFEYFALP